MGGRNMTEKKSGLSIRQKLMLSYFSIVVLILVIGGVGIYNIRVVYDNGNAIYENNLQSVEFLKSINQNVKEIDQCVISMMSQLDEDYHEKYLSEISLLQQQNTDLMERYSKLSVTSLEKRRYNQCRLSILTFDKHINNIVDYIRQGDMDMAVAAYEQELMPAKASTYELIEAVVDISTNNASSKNQENYNIYRNNIWIISAIMVLAIIIAIIITLSMSSYFVNKLLNIQLLAKRMSEYNIADDVTAANDDEFGQTIQALNDSQFMMRDLVEKIIDESASISDAGEDVSLAVRKTTQRIEQINVQVLSSTDMAAKMDTTIRKILENRNLDEETVSKLNWVLESSDNARDILTDARAELSSLAMYLDQIGITSDYQNELANSHREQVQKFKV
jgi:methyl-accepting chemotaxis protein